MDVIEVLDQVRELLQRQGRLSYRLLKKQFALDEEGLEDLKYEFVDIQELAVDKDGKMLVWTGSGAPVVAPEPAPSQSQSPVSYTPQHLAERILAEQAAMESRGAPSSPPSTIGSPKALTPRI